MNCGQSSHTITGTYKRNCPWLVLPQKNGKIGLKSGVEGHKQDFQILLSGCVD